MSFFEELKRRNVIRVAIAYLITAWLVAQVLELLFDSFGTPDWVMKTIIVLMAFGLVFAVIFAWAYELTPDGIKRESEVDGSSITPLTARRLDRAIIIVLVLAVAYFVWESRFSGQSTVPGEVASESDAVQYELPVDLHLDPSIAVLPFADMSPDQDQEYFSDGIAEELLNLLVRVDGLTVASRTSSFSYKDSNRPIAEIAADLKVDHILEGSVRKADNRVRITAQLIDADTDRHLWSDTYDRELNDIFAIQDEIANAIVDALKSELGMLEGAGPVQVAADTRNLDAYDLFLEARSLFLARQELDRSIELFEQAVSLDPGFARAWENLAATLSVADGWGYLIPDQWKRARFAAERAIELDDGLSMAWAVLGTVRIDNDADFIGGMNSLERAIDNDPRNATALLWRGAHWSYLGFNARGIADLEQCLVLEPRYMNCTRHLARMHSIDGNIDTALALYTEVVQLGVSNFEYWLIPHLLERGNDLGAGLALVAESLGDRDYPFVELLQAYRGEPADRAIGVAKLVAWADRNGVGLQWLGGAFITLGAYEQVSHSFNGNIIWQDSSWKFRESSEFKRFTTETGVLDYWREVEWPDRCRPLGEDDFECD